MKLYKIFLFFLFFSCGYPQAYNPVESEYTNYIGIDIISDDILLIGDEIPVSFYLIHESGSKVPVNVIDAAEISIVFSNDKILYKNERGVLEGLAEGETEIEVFFKSFYAAKIINVRKKPDYSFLFLNEIFYNPEGRDAGLEFVEIINRSPEDVDISGAALIDGSLKSSRFIFPANTIINSNGIFIIGASFDIFMEKFLVKPDFFPLGFQLNNNGESVMLLTPEGDIVDIVYISGGTDDFPGGEEWVGDNILKADEGMSLNRIEYGEGPLCWTQREPGPGY